MGSKIHSGPSREAKLKRRRFLMPRGHLKDLFWETIWEAKIVPNPLRKRFEDAIHFEERFGKVLEASSSPSGRAIPTTVTKAKSFKTPVFSQSHCIFAMLIMQEQRLQEPSFSRSVTDMHQKACLDLLWASIWGPIEQPKSIQNRSRGDQDGHWILDIDCGALALAGKRVDCTPNPPPATGLYIY